MRTEELMRNDWVKLCNCGLLCRIDEITPDSILGTTLSGGKIIQKISKFEPIVVDRDIICRTDFWLHSKRIFKKSVKEKDLAFIMDLDTNSLTVMLRNNGVMNTHEVNSLHTLQQLYRLYVKEEMVINLAHNKRKEYNREAYQKRKSDYLGVEDSINQ